MTLARWESRSKKHWVELIQTDHGFKYSAPDCGGYLEAQTRLRAVKELQAKVDTGYFQPDANKTPLRRVDAHLCSICRQVHGYETSHACE